ncbi:Similar to CREG1: Protein CREG1 (Homo sapiens) [Cotesia congregata]|uniref:Similar to CREG1: Protein CREG1 (Homo sapiens) n=1 Tax=Cotesia congregata TaxID=51543 RepID=A0A8J2HQE3_COTCN|nr:Similar to CREG1: Protein CREG1 (Homo sapiens) [Cotesia congregata]
MSCQYKLVVFATFFFIIVYSQVNFTNAKKRYSPWNSEDDEQLWRKYEECRDFQDWKKFSKLNNHYKKNNNFGFVDDDSRRENAEFDAYSAKDISDLPGDDLPPEDHPALVGRYVVNQSNWTSVATISRQQGIASFPFANVVALSDGPRGNGSGVPYMFLTPLDFTSKDLKEDARATLMVTLAQDHEFYFAKLKIFFIAVLDTFGGAKFVSVKDYYNPPASKPSENYEEYMNYPMPYVNQF